MADTFDDRFGFEPRKPTGDPSIDAILPPYVPKGETPITPPPPAVPKPVPDVSPLDAVGLATEGQPSVPPSLPTLPTGNPNPFVTSPAYESHGGVDYSGRPSSLAEAYARGSVDPRSLTADQLARVKAEIAANPTIGTTPTRSRRG